jgi:hypothetical protein
MSVRNRLFVLAMILALAPLVGCSSVGVALGLRTRLDQLPITSLNVQMVPPALSPGARGHLIIEAQSSDGKRYVTAGAGKGRVTFDSFDLSASHASVSGSGVVQLASDPRQSSGAAPLILVKVHGHPLLDARFEVPLRYDVAFTANFSGRNGGSGINGFSGINGLNGTNGSMDLLNPTAGGNGSDGTDGGNGGDGGNGADGARVNVWITTAQNAAPDHPLLQVEVAGIERREFYLIDPHGGTLTVVANGGAGGAGGLGGSGGRGGQGGMGTPSGLAGRNGQDGRRGFDGRPGAAGWISVEADPRAQTYLGIFHLENKSGSGAPGPAPAVSVQAVAPRW